MTKKDDFRVGFISSPHPHSPMHMKTLEVMPEISEIHLCGIGGEDLNALGAISSKVQSSTTDLSTFFANKSIDAVIVSVRNDLCPDVLAKAIAFNLPVLFEKPGAVSSMELRKISNAASVNNLIFGAMYQNRWKKSMKQVRDLVSSGALGTIMAIEARTVTSQVRYRDPDHWLFKKEYSGSGILSWLACHQLDLMCHILGNRVVEVSAMVSNLNPEEITVEDTAVLNLKFDSGVIGSMHAGYHMAGSNPGYAGGSYDNFLGIRGVGGYIRVPSATSDSYEIYTEVDAWVTEKLETREFASIPSEAYGGKVGEDFVSDFLKASRDGLNAPAPIEDAIHVLDIVEAALESSETGRSVTVRN
tara:strand:- start:2228 stop:3304 length:1077 start_codon:yes stop_codon:yes gene_type:complete